MAKIKHKKSSSGNGQPTNNSNGAADNRSFEQWLGDNPEFTWAFNEAIANASLSRTEMINRMMDPRRDINDECGYPTDTLDIPISHYRKMFDRDPIGNRVISILPDECWKVMPDVIEDDDADSDTPFENGVKQLGKDLFGSGFLEDNEVNPLWNFLRRVDVLSGIGHYGAIFIGIADGLKPEEPAKGLHPLHGFPTVDEESQKPIKPVANKARQPIDGATHKITFLRALDEESCKVNKWVDDKTSPRYGQPESYLVTINNLHNNSNETATGVDTGNLVVHWTRIVHITDNAGTNDFIGDPRLRPVYNRVYDCMKLFGGSAEMFWQGAFMGLSFETHPQLGGDVDVDAEAMKDNIEKYLTGLQRYVLNKGMIVKSLAPQVADPSNHIKVQLEAICVYLGCPMRIFLGSERGELSSGQDADTWNDRLEDRQNNHITVKVIAAFLNRCIHLGLLPRPVSFKVVWPDLNTTTDAERATVAGSITESLVKYVAGDVIQMVEPLDYWTRIIGLSEDEARAIIKNRQIAIEDEALKQQEAGDAAREQMMNGIEENNVDGNPSPMQQQSGEVVDKGNKKPFAKKDSNKPKPTSPPAPPKEK